MAVFVIEHPGAGRWYAMYGWVPRLEMALRFASLDEAERFIKDTLPGRAGNAVRAEPREDARGDPLRETKTDYDPFGLLRGE